MIKFLTFYDAIRKTDCDYQTKDNTQLIILVVFFIFIIILLVGIIFYLMNKQKICCPQQNYLTTQENTCPEGDKVLNRSGFSLAGENNVTPQQIEYYNQIENPDQYTNYDSQIFLNRGGNNIK